MALTPQIIGFEFLRLLAGDLEPRGEIVHSEHTGAAGAKQGDTVRLRSNASFRPRDLLDFSDSFNITETSTFVVLEHHSHITVELDFLDMEMGISQFSARHLEPSAQQLARVVVGSWGPGATLVTADLQIPMGLNFALLAVDPGSALSVRLIGQPNFATNQQMLRFDILYGFSVVRYVPTLVERRALAILKRRRQELVADLERWREAA